MKHWHWDGQYPYQPLPEVKPRKRDELRRAFALCLVVGLLLSVLTYLEWQNLVGQAGAANGAILVPTDDVSGMTELVLQSVR